MRNGTLVVIDKSRMARLRTLQYSAKGARIVIGRIRGALQSFKCQRYSHPSKGHSDSESNSYGSILALSNMMLSYCKHLRILSILTIAKARGRRWLHCDEEIFIHEEARKCLAMRSLYNQSKIGLFVSWNDYNSSQVIANLTFYFMADPLIPIPASPCFVPQCFSHSSKSSL